VSHSKKRIARLIERDGNICWLCNKPCDVSRIGTGHRNSPTADHVVPKSHGGPNKMENFKLAHNQCNTRRGNKFANSLDELNQTWLKANVWTTDNGRHKLK
jgi:5-methylcytosine-specific restriction endonuclease McrA